MPKSEPFSIRLEQDLKEWAEARAGVEGRKLGNLIEYALNKYRAEADPPRKRK